MTDTNENLLRIYSNICVLLDNGQFPGRDAQAIFEARALISGVVADLKAKTDEQGQQEGAGSGNRDGADGGRVVDGDVPARGRKSRGKRSVGT